MLVLRTWPRTVALGNLSSPDKFQQIRTTEGRRVTRRRRRRFPWFPKPTSLTGKEANQMMRLMEELKTTKTYSTPMRISTLRSRNFRLWHRPDDPLMTDS
jgi:hypothetical protein